MKNITPIKVYGILIIAAFVWWGIWGHQMTSDSSDYWFHEDSNQCAPAYPLIGLAIIVGSWSAVIAMNGPMKWYGDWKRDRWIMGGLFTVLFLIIFARIIFN
jgi:hypothetical protein